MLPARRETANAGLTASLSNTAQQRDRNRQYASARSRADCQQSLSIPWSSTLIAVLWSVGILGVTVAGILGVRTLPGHVRAAFDLVCLAAAGVVLYQHGVTPLALPTLGSSNSPEIWLRAVAVAWWLLSARVIVAVLYYTLRHDRKSREAKLFIDLAAAAIYVGAGLIVLKSVLALSVGGLVATSGVVAIVLGLALQSTLSDVFSGIAVDIEAPFQVGDRISLGNNIEGQVVEMNWRSIRVQTDGADIAIIPNSVVAKLEIVNRSVPTRVRAVSVQLWCAASGDSERVVEILQEATLLCPPILATPAPSVTLNRIGPRWNNYTISFSVPDTQLVAGTKSLLLRHARKQLYHARLLSHARTRDEEPCDDRLHTILPTRQMLRELTLFEGLQPAQLEELAHRVATRLVEPDEVLFSQGTADATLYIVASGILEITALSDGVSVTLGNLGAGEYVGEICLLTGTPHAASARARTHCYIHHLSREAIEPILAANPALAVAFDKSIRRGLDLLKRSVAARATESADAGGQLLQRIRAFFRFKSAA
jgi:small-conductance mechanosensitive channel/CRP-like cAMP-binding protein